VVFVVVVMAVVAVVVKVIEVVEVVEVIEMVEVIEVVKVAMVVVVIVVMLLELVLVLHVQRSLHFWVYFCVMIAAARAALVVPVHSHHGCWIQARIVGSCSSLGRG